MAANYLTPRVGTRFTDNLGGLLAFAISEVVRDCGRGVWEVKDEDGDTYRIAYKGTLGIPATWVAVLDRKPARAAMFRGEL